MSSKGKGKEVVGGKDSSRGKRKRLNDDDKTGGRARKSPGVLQFFDNEAGDAAGYQSSDESSFDDDFISDMFGSDTDANADTGKPQLALFMPKQEEMREEEFDKMMEERYTSGSRSVRYTEDSYEMKKSVHVEATFPPGKDPIVWRIKCAVGRERHSVFCLMQKFVELQALGKKLQIVSAISLEHVKGYIFVEAPKQVDVNEACKGLCNIFLSRTSRVPTNEISQLLAIRSKHNEVTEGTWAQVKSGKYKGDLAQVVAVNDVKKRAMVKLIPRIDVQALAEKFGGSCSVKKATNPAPRLICLSELEEFRTLIQLRRDRDTDLVFHVLDNLMLKDGYIYKRVPLDSLNFSGVTPSGEEILKFNKSEKPVKNNEKWLSQLYGGDGKKQQGKSKGSNDKGCGKGEGSSSSLPSGFEIHDLVCFGRKDFGIILGYEKDCCKVLKDAAEGSVVVTVDLHQLTAALSDTKFTALDHNKKPVSAGDTVKIIEGPSQGREGIVKQVYRGILFLKDENEENDGYFCAKSFMSEKTKLVSDTFQTSGGDFGFADTPSSPKSHIPRERNSGRGAKDGMFSVGQALRIRVGPLKGYLCRVLAIRYSDVTVKLDSQTKILTVKSEHLSEIRKTFTNSASDNLDLKSSDFPGNRGSSGDWGTGMGTSTESNGWNVGGASTERSGWSSLPAAGTATAEGTTDPLSSWDNNSKKVDAGVWGSTAVTNQNTTWSGWGQKKPDDNEKDNNGASGSNWGKAAEPLKDPTDGAGSENNMDANQSSTWGGWGQKKTENHEKADTAALGPTWGSDGATGVGNKMATGQSSAWGRWSQKKPEDGKKDNNAASKSTWGKAVEPSSADTAINQSSAWKIWGHEKLEEKDNSGTTSGSSWGKTVEPSSNFVKGADGWGNTAATHQSSSWGGWSHKNTLDGEKDVSEPQATSWNKPENSLEGGSTWNKESGGDSSWNKEAEKQDSASAWVKKDVNRSHSGGWNAVKNSDQEALRWGTGGSTDQTNGWKQPQTSSSIGGSSWNKQGSESAWGKLECESSWHKNGSQEDDQDTVKSFEGGRGSGGRWGRGSRGGRDQYGRGRSFGRGLLSEWNKGDQDSSGTNSGWKADQSGSWGQSKISGGDAEDNGNDASKKIGNTWKTSGEGSSGWESKGNWGQSSNNETGDQDGWSKKSNWGNASSESQTLERENNEWGGGGGRGDSERGSFRGRGRSDRGGFGGRGSFDRGGRRGGFGGRGSYCGRDRGRGDGNRGGWKDGDSSQQRSWSHDNGGGWGKETGCNNKGGWNKEGGSASVGGSQNSNQPQWQSWNSGGGGNQSGGWKSAGGLKETGGSSSEAGQCGNKDENVGGWKKADTTSHGGWNKEPVTGSGDDSQTKLQGGWGCAPGSSAEPSAASNQSSGWGGGEGTGWNQGTEPKGVGGSDAQTGEKSWG